MFIIFLALFSGISAQNFLYLGLNDVCKDGSNVWRCKSLGNCPAIKELREKGQRPDVCSFQGPEPIICCPPSTEVDTETTTTRRPTTQPTTRRTTTKPYWWTTNRINGEEEPPVWGSWTTRPSGNTKPPTKKPTHQTKSIAEQKCEEYGQYVYRIEESPSLLPNQKPDKIKINECNIQTLIVGGVNAMSKEFPHMALIGYGDKPKIDWLCGGSLISPKFVLSAAHCTKPDNRVGQATWVRLGDLDISINNDDAEPIELRIKRRINHPQYNRQRLYHDIALFELEREVQLNTYIRPLCLSTGNDVDIKSAMASGWGHTSWGGRGSSMLQKVNLTVVSNEKCNNNYGRGEYRQQLPNGIVEDLMLCAGGQPGKDTCQGDSGGPLQIEHKSVYCMYSQIGVVSFGKGCALTFPGVYTRVSNYLEWIESIVWP
ncbi:venom protease isoform X2 [Halyomorpha halys]|uniref:venom protease isoform X2 n=1 Tax=Halyomorpha halys TaxID=286706 RepID=UPI0006D51F16|nr:venom serine protease Bi-VSP isoform X2 [Halyomorpha halys]KAE8573470.1 Putative serine protease persephone-like [Halyomorpha halys]